MEVPPFESFARNLSPAWFRKYSKRKHDRIRLADEWTMWDSVNCLAGLAIIANEMRLQAGFAGANKYSRVFQLLFLPRL